VSGLSEKILAFATQEVKDYMVKVKEQNIRKGYLGSADVDQINELIDKCARIFDIGTVSSDWGQSWLNRFQTVFSFNTH